MLTYYAQTNKYNYSYNRLGGAVNIDKKNIIYYGHEKLLKVDFIMQDIFLNR